MGQAKGNWQNLPLAHVQMLAVWEETSNPSTTPQLQPETTPLKRPLMEVS